MPELKVTTTHLDRDAYLYIRQSTPRQVLENTESTQRQYALRNRALAHGWPQERIHVIDCDLGKSAALAAGRDGFQQLVSEVALGKAGIVLGLEVSRLARNSADWHRLIELCSLTGTLILDEDGIYDPAVFSDRLLLGLKGELSQAELHVLKARMRGGVLNKARRGELEMGPPIGLIYRSDATITIDPDQEIRAALRLVFDTFERTGSALQTVRLFRDQGLRFPRRVHAGANKGELFWGEPSHSRIIQILHNPRYAGAFVYGRTRTARKPDGKYSQVKIPQEKWQYVVRDVHSGYITWEQFEANQKRLAENALGFGSERKFGPVREGAALLQGRVLCGICGERMGVRYHAENSLVLPTYVCQEDAVRLGAKVCQSVPGKVVDPAISDLLLELVQPLTLEIAIAVQQEVEARFTETDALRRQRVERARYEAELARRRYMSVDPANRLVVDALEAEWNDKLRIYGAAQEDYERQSQQQRRRIDDEARQRILSLASDFPLLWSDPSVEPRERKRMLRLLIEDVTLLKADVITVQVRLRGGATRTLVLPKPVPIAQIRKVKPAIVAEIDRLLDHHCDREVAEILNRNGHRTWQNQPFALKKVAWTRGAYRLQSHFGRLRAKGYLTADECEYPFRPDQNSLSILARNRYSHRVGISIHITPNDYSHAPESAAGTARPPMLCLETDIECLPRPRQRDSGGNYITGNAVVFHGDNTFDALERSIRSVVTSNLKVFQEIGEVFARSLEDPRFEPTERLLREPLSTIEMRATRRTLSSRFLPLLRHAVATLTALIEELTCHIVTQASCRCGFPRDRRLQPGRDLA